MVYRIANTVNSEVNVVSGLASERPSVTEAPAGLIWVAEDTGEVSVFNVHTATWYAMATAESDPAVAALDWKTSVRAATTTNITLSGTQTIDGIALVVGDRALVKNQSLPRNNGIYVVAAGTWARATDADTSAEVTSGLALLVGDGTVQKSTIWLLTTVDPIVLGTTNLVFTQLISATPPDGSTIEINGGTLRVKAGGIGISHLNFDPATQVELDATISALTLNLRSAAYGAVGDAKTVIDAVINSSSSTLTSATAAFVSGDVGKRVYVAGAGASGATLRTTISALTNSTTVTLGAAASTSVTAAWATYGTDDSTGIQAALDAAGAMVNGATVHAPKGTYLVDVSLSIPSKVTLTGDAGTVFITGQVGTGGGAGFALIKNTGWAASTACANLRIQRITFRNISTLAGTEGPYCAAVSIRRGTDVDVVDCRFEGFMTGASIEACDRYAVSRCVGYRQGDSTVKFSWSGSDGAGGPPAKHALLESTYSIDAGGQLAGGAQLPSPSGPLGSAIVITQSGVKVSDCTVIDSWARSVETGAHPEQITFENLDLVVVTAGRNVGMNLADCHRVMVRNVRARLLADGSCIINPNTTSGDTNYTSDIVIEGCSGTNLVSNTTVVRSGITSSRVRGLVIRGCDYVGLHINVTNSLSRRTIVEDCTVRAAATAAILASSHDVTLRGNLVYDPGAGGAPLQADAKQRAGFVIDTCTGDVIDNQVIDTGAAALTYGYYLIAGTLGWQNNRAVGYTVGYAAEDTSPVVAAPLELGKIAARTARQYGVAGDTVARLAMFTDHIEAGPGGASALDTTLRRGGAGFWAAPMLIKAGTPVDGDYATAPPDGTSAFDSTSGLWIRSGGSWVQSDRKGWRRFATGKFYGPLNYAGTTDGPPPDGKNIISLLPFIVDNPTTFDRFAFYLTLAQASSFYQMAIYSEVAGKPSALILDSGQVDTTTGAGAAVTVTISQLLQPGLYFMASFWGGAGATGPSVTKFTAAANLSPYFGVSSSGSLVNGGNLERYWSYSGSGTMPATVTPAGGNSSGASGFFLRAA